eukprot:TRINITY_DN5637_c0_g1_i2.p1 TRINITY_DN5637_c0_g1~~TRINITY_DN5637_c0_g1_i2.p1  ORF type:complete len:1842 (+),score=450.14 TRINITY_DN5637_c0_g1_i2:990-6515(+)
MSLRFSVWFLLNWTRKKTSAATCQKKVINQLLFFRWSAVAQTLRLLQHSKEGIKFTSMLLTYSVKDAIASQGKRMSNLSSLLETMQPTEGLGYQVGVVCFREIIKDQQQTCLQDVLKLLETHCPSGFDDALKVTLETSSKSDCEVLFKLVKQSFKGTSRHQPVKGSDGMEYSLTVACLHHEAGIRLVAASELQKIIKEMSSKSKQLQTFVDMYIHMISIEEDKKVLTCLLEGISGVVAKSEIHTMKDVMEPLSKGKHLSDPTLASLIISNLATDEANSIVAATASLYRVIQRGLAFGNTRSSDLLKSLGVSKKLPTLEQFHELASKRAISTNAVASYNSHLETCLQSLQILRSRGEATERVINLEEDIIHCVSVLAHCETDDFTTRNIELFKKLKDDMLTVFTKKDYDSTAKMTTPMTSHLRSCYVAIVKGTVLDTNDKLADYPHSRVLGDCIIITASMKQCNQDCDDILDQILKSNCGIRAFSHICQKAQIYSADRKSKSAVVKTATSSLARYTKESQKGSWGTGKTLQLVSSLLCLLSHRQSDAVLVEVQKALRSLKCEDNDMKQFVTSLADRTLDLEAEHISSVVGSILEGPNANHLISDFCACSLEWHMGDMSSALSKVTSLAKLRGFIPLLSAFLSQPDRTARISPQKGRLLAAAVGSFSALWTLKRGEWKKTSDRSSLLSIFCQCMQMSTPVLVCGADDGDWCSDIEGNGNGNDGTTISVQELIYQVVVGGVGNASKGMKQWVESLSEGEVQQLVDSVFASVSSGSAPGRQIAKASHSFLSPYVRLHTALLAGRWCKNLASTDPLTYSDDEEELRPAAFDSDNDEEPQTNSRKRRKPTAGQTARASKKSHSEKETTTNIVSDNLCKGIETLLLYHDGIHPQKGQDPIAVGSLAWRCLRVECHKKRSERNEYLISLLTTLLSNCTFEVAWHKKKDPTSTVDTVIPSEYLNPASLADRECDVLSATGSGMIIVDLDEFVAILKGSHRLPMSVRTEGLKVFRNLIEVQPSAVYGSCLRFVVASIGINDPNSSCEELLESMLENLLPGMLTSEAGDELITLIHIVLYSYASRRGSTENALDGCHNLLNRCNIHYQLVALNSLLKLTINDDSEMADEEQSLLKDLGVHHPSTLSPEQIEMRIILFVLRHVVSDSFIDTVLDEDEALKNRSDDDEDPAYYESFTNLFLSLLQIYKDKVLQFKDDDDDVDTTHSSEEDSTSSSELSDGASSSSDQNDTSEKREDDLYNLKVALKKRVKQLIVSVVDVMPTPVFIAAIQELLSEKGFGLQALGLRLFNSKLSAMGDSLSDEDAYAFVTMLPELKDALEDKTVNCDPHVVQSSLWTLEILARYLAPHHPKNFAYFLPSLKEVIEIHFDEMKKSNPASCAVVSSAILTFGHICHEIASLSIGHIPTLVPFVLDVVESAAALTSGTQLSSLSEPVPHIKMLNASSCAALSKIVQSLADFMSPFMTRIAGIATSRGIVAIVPDYAERLLNSMVSYCQSRLLIPALASALETHPSNSYSHPMLWGAISTLLEDVENFQVLSVMELVMKVVVSSFKDYTHEGLASLDVFKAMGGAITSLALKLDGKRLNMCLSALQQSAFAYDRNGMSLTDQRQVIAYLIVVSCLQNVLVNIFCPIFKGFTPQVCEALTCKKDVKSGNPIMASTLLTIGLKVIKKQMEDDQTSEIGSNADLALEVMNSVCDAMANKNVLEAGLAFEVDEDTIGNSTTYSEKCRDFGVTILVRLCHDCTDRSLWSAVQKKLLDLFRTATDPAVRYEMLSALKSLYTDVGQEFAAAVVAEMLQPVSEALDDDETEISKLAVDLVRTCSKLTGEDIASYMRA